MAERIVQILLGDDSQDDASFLLRALQERSIEASSVVHVIAGEAVLASLSSGRKFDLAVLDYYLPQRTAYEIAVQLREDQHVIAFPIVVLTSYLPPARIRELNDLGIHNIIQKPSDWQGYQDLVAVLMRMMNMG